MGFIKKISFVWLCGVLPTAITAGPGGIQGVFVRGIGSDVGEVVAYPDTLGTIFTLTRIQSEINSHHDLVRATKLSIAALGFVQDYSEEDADKKSVFIRQELDRVSPGQVAIARAIARNFNLSNSYRKVFDNLVHVLYWKSLYHRACLQGNNMPQDRSVEVIDASGLNLSTINFQVLRSLFPSLKKINLSNNQIRYIEDAQLPHMRNLEIDLRGNSLEKVSYGLLSSGCTMHLDETAPVYASLKFRALYAGVLCAQKISGFPKSFAQRLFSPLARRDNRPSLVGSVVSCVVPDFARDSIEQQWHDFVYRSALGSLVSRTASFTIPLARPWFYYPLHDATRSVLARYKLGTSAVGKILYPLGLTAMCGWLNRYASRIPGVDEISYVWDTVHDSLARHVPFRAQVIGAIGLIAVTGVAEYIHHRTPPATIKIHRSGQ